MENYKTQYTMKTKQYLCFIFTAIAVNSFAFTVSKNTVMTIGNQTQVKMTNLDLHNAGNLIGDTASLLIISNTRESKISGNPIFLGSLRIVGNAFCKVPILTLYGDLIMQSGVMNIETNRLIIHGNLFGENEKTYVTAFTGTIETPVKYLPAGRSFTALGLEFTPMNTVYNVWITRSHNPITRTTRISTTYSADRVYEFCTPIGITGIQKQTLPHELTNISNPAWFVQDFEKWRRVRNRNDGFFIVSKVSTFNPDELHFPKVVTPNLSTNTTFEIIGVEEYPNARLIVINRGGKVLYDLYPYTNNFDIKNLPDGTYYYVFSEGRNSPPVKKSFFEIVR